MNPNADGAPNAAGDGGASGAAPPKLNFKRTLDSYRASRGQFRVLEVPPLQYLMVEGHGDPNVVPEYADALATLYPMAYQLKFASKRALGRDYVVPPLEGLWWADDPTAFTSARDKSRWNWTMMILTPDWVTREMFDEAASSVAAGDSLAPSIHRLRLATLVEGACVQTLHVGSYDDEAPVLAQLHDGFLPGAGLRPVGKHHEIYLSDPRRVVPERLRTILRQPVAPV